METRTLDLTAATAASAATRAGMLQLTTHDAIPLSISMFCTSYKHNCSKLQLAIGETQPL